MEEGLLCGGWTVKEQQKKQGDGGGRTCFGSNGSGKWKALRLNLRVEPVS